MDMFRVMWYADTIAGVYPVARPRELVAEEHRCPSRTDRDR
jgi:hypothetical protein